MTKPLCIALRHVPFESLGLLEPVLESCGYEIRIHEVPTTALPRALLHDAALVVVLGGPISAYEEHLYPFLVDELHVIERRLLAEKPTIGICLGAQLMARALGARVYPGEVKEIGWSRLHMTPQGEQSFLSELGQQRVLHWHGDTFELPPGANLLASTKLTQHQAFLWKNIGIGLQFHIEVAAGELEAWYVGHALELSRWAKVPIPELRAAGQTFAPLLEPYARQAIEAMLRPLQVE